MYEYDVNKNIQTTVVGGLPIACIGLSQTARLIVDAAKMNEKTSGPLYFTSANGEVVSNCRTDRQFAKLIHGADLISADGQSIVFASRLLARRALPERVATTDLFDLVAADAERSGVSFYLFGASDRVNEEVYKRTRRLFPNLPVLGRCHGYLKGSALSDKIDEINVLAPDILWVALGVPLEQRFVSQWRHRLSNVGLIKTAGGLFDFLSGHKRRAPRWMQNAGLEWFFRLCLEPRRLASRYAVTSPIALLEMIRSTH